MGTLFKTNFGTALNCAPVRPWKGRFRRRGRTRRTLAGSRYRLAVSSWVVGDPFFLESPINIKLTVLFSTYLVVDTFIWSELVRPAKNANALHLIFSTRRRPFLFAMASVLLNAKIDYVSPETFPSNPSRDRTPIRIPTM